MATLLEQQVNIILTSVLGRAPTAEELRLGTIAPYPLSPIHNTTNVAQNTLSISDTDDIQTAINKIFANGGGVVYLNPGTYNVTSDITLPSNTYLVGLVASSCIIDFGGTSSSIIANSVGYSSIQELTIQNSSDAGIKFIDNTGLLTIDNVIVLDCAKGLYCLDCSNGVNIMEGGMEIRDCGIGLDFDTVIGLEVLNTSILTSTSDGIVVNDLSFAMFSHVIIENCGRDGINSSSMSGIFMNDMFILSNGRDGIRLVASNGGMIMSGNLIESNTGYGINITAASNGNNIISSNIFVGNTAGPVNDSGTNTLIRSNIGVADN